jgi:hypothetical protein
MSLALITQRGTEDQFVLSVWMAQYVIGLRPLAFCIREFESHQGHVCLSVLCVLCDVRQRSMWRADHSSRGVLPTVARRCVWSRNVVWRGGHTPRWTAEPETEIGNSNYMFTQNFSDISHLKTSTRVSPPFCPIYKSVRQCIDFESVKLQYY